MVEGGNGGPLCAQEIRGQSEENFASLRSWTGSLLKTGPGAKGRNMERSSSTWICTACSTFCRTELPRAFRNGLKHIRKSLRFPVIAADSMPREHLWARRQCQQVADQFHLILNLSTTMERVLEERSRQLNLPIQVPVFPFDP
jgi:hypothetical protein